MIDYEYLLQEEQRLLDEYCEIIYAMKKLIAKELTSTDEEFWTKLDDLILLDETRDKNE